MDAAEIERTFGKDRIWEHAEELLNNVRNIGEGMFTKELTLETVAADSCCHDNSRRKSRRLLKFISSVYL